MRKNGKSNMAELALPTIQVIRGLDDKDHLTYHAEVRQGRRVLFRTSGSFSYREVYLKAIDWLEVYYA